MNDLGGQRRPATRRRRWPDRWLLLAFVVLYCGCCHRSPSPVYHTDRPTKLTAPIDDGLLSADWHLLPEKIMFKWYNYYPDEWTDDDEFNRCRLTEIKEESSARSYNKLVTDDRHQFITLTASTYVDSTWDDRHDNSYGWCPPKFKWFAWTSHALFEEDAFAIRRL